MDCSPPGSSVRGILQARILKWGAISFSRGSSWPTDWTWVSCIAGTFFIVWTTREAHCISISIAIFIYLDRERKLMSIADSQQETEFCHWLWKLGSGSFLRWGLRWLKPTSYLGCHLESKWVSEVAQSCLTLCDPMDCSPPGSSIHGIFQARVLEWGAVAFFSHLGKPEPKPLPDSHPIETVR